MTKNDLIIPVPLAQAIANYLQERPYREVAVLLAELSRLKTIPDHPTEVHRTSHP